MRTTSKEPIDAARDAGGGSASRPSRRDVLAYGLAMGAASALPTTGALAQEASQGIDVASKTVRIGAFYPVTGPVPFYAVITRSADAFFKNLNANGGIRGWKFEYIIKDDGYEPARSVAVTHRLVEDDKIFALVAATGTAQNIAVIPYAREHNLPVVAPVGGSPKLVAEPNIFPLLPEYALSAASSAEYALKTLKKKRIGLLWVNDEVGRGAKRGIDLYLKSENLDLAMSSSFDIGSTDFSAHVRRVADAEADVVILFGSNANLAGSLRAADKLGYKTDWFGPFFTADPTTYNLAKDLLNGTYFSSWLLPVDSDNAAVKLYRETIPKYYPQDPVGVFGLNGWTSASLFAVAFEKMLDQNLPLTRDSLIQVLNTLTNQPVGAVKTVTFTKDDHRGIREEAIIQAQDGKFRLVRDYQPYPAVVFNAKAG